MMEYFEEREAIAMVKRIVRVVGTMQEYVS